MVERVREQVLREPPRDLKLGSKFAFEENLSGDRSDRKKPN